MDQETKDEIMMAIETDEALAMEKQEDLYEDLTDRQKLIARLRLRGLSQTVIANFLGVSQPIVHKELKRIRASMESKGAVIDQNVAIGETRTVYEDVEKSAWELYTTSQEVNDKAKALGLVLSAREKHMKLLMDLGKVTRAPASVKVEHSSPLIEALNNMQKDRLVENVLSSTLKPLVAPEPPTKEYIDAVIVEDEEDE